MKSRKVKLSPVQRDILMILEEAGEESLGHLVSELHFGGALSEGGHDLQAVDEAIRALQRAGYVGFAYESGSHDARKVFARDIVTAHYSTSDYLEFADKRWRWKPAVGNPVLVVLTAKGQHSVGLSE